MKQLSIQQLMAQSGVGFGTSGARGLATALTDFVCYAYTQGFLQYLESVGELKAKGGEVAVAGDLRPSTNRIMEAIFRAIEDMKYRPVNCGQIPSPAVALYGLAKHAPAVMVTGSHIPDDRNGIKFNKCAGEILKDDETGITRQSITVDATQFMNSGAFARPGGRNRPVQEEARAAYAARYLACFPSGSLRGCRIGVYQHSAVGRDLLGEILDGLGAETTPLGRSEKFIPVDTEAIRPEDTQLAREWAATQRFDAIVSTDGDSDRPLISDERGHWLRGDIAGILCAKFLGADSVCVPVSCNTAVERSGFFREVRRTRIGSPYVIAAMQDASNWGARQVVGYEANGGFLTNSNIQIGRKTLPALPTRDSVIVLLSVLLMARQEGQTISQLAAALPARYTASDRLKNCPPEKSRAVIERFSCGDDATDKRALEAVFESKLGQVSAIDRTDGLRVTFANGEIVHLRPSGNAPEFRCYNEADSQQRANQLNVFCLDILRDLARV